MSDDEHDKKPDSDNESNDEPAIRHRRYHKRLDRHDKYREFGNTLWNERKPRDAQEKRVADLHFQNKVLQSQTTRRIRGKGPRAKVVRPGKNRRYRTGGAIRRFK